MRCHMYLRNFLLSFSFFSSVSNGYSINGISDRINTIKHVKHNSRCVSTRRYAGLNMNLNRGNILPSEIIKQLSKSSPKPGSTWTYQTFIDNLNKNNVDSVSIFSDEKGFAVIDKNVGDINDIGLTGDNVHLVGTLPNMINDLIERLNSNHIQYDIYNLPIKNGGSFDFLILPLEFIGFYLIATVVLNVIINFFRGGGMGRGGMGGGIGQNPLNMFKQENELIDTENIGVTFEDVAGCDEAKFELMEIVDFLKT